MLADIFGWRVPYGLHITPNSWPTPVRSIKDTEHMTTKTKTIIETTSKRSRKPATKKVAKKLSKTTTAKRSVKRS